MTRFSDLLFHTTFRLSFEISFFRKSTRDSCVTEFNGDTSQVIANGYILYVNGVAITGTE